MSEPQKDLSPTEVVTIRLILEGSLSQLMRELDVRRKLYLSYILHTLLCIYFLYKGLSEHSWFLAVVSGLLLYRCISKTLSMRQECLSYYVQIKLLSSLSIPDSNSDG